MRFALAPMEGLTTYVYRNAYHRHFVPADRYYTPFLAPNMDLGLGSKELKEVSPEHNTALPLVPQLLTNRADHFLPAAQVLADLGYTEVNLNLGCPSGTVVAKGKGSGFLSDREGLARFLDEIFAKSPLPISIKTRIGRWEDGEWPDLLDLFRRYPLTELIVHPRVQKDYYRNTPRREAYALALKDSPFPVVYNGDLFTRGQVEDFQREFPQADTVMVGRGVLHNPWLLGGTPDKGVLADFLEDLTQSYRQILYGDAQVLSKLKGIWAYLGQMFTNHAPYEKSIRKARRMEDYEVAVRALLSREELLPDAPFVPDNKTF